MTLAASYKKSDLPVTLTADGDYFFDIWGPGKAIGDFNTLYAKGNFGSGTLTANATPDKSTKFPITGSDLTAAGFVNLLVKSEGFILSLTGSTAAAIVVDIK